MLEIRDLSVRIGGNEVVAIEALDLLSNQRLGLVGESGSGKTMTAMSIAGLQAPEAKLSGSIRFDGRELLDLPERELARIRGAEMGVIFQDPLRALNPVMRIGRQVVEAIRLHRDVSRTAAQERAVELLSQVHLPDPETLLRRYPHQLSGGQRQRVLIAMAIASRPRLLIADEPTTALDVTVQQGVLELLLRLSEEQGMGLLFVSHDLGVVQAVSERIAVLYAGQLVEVGPADTVVQESRHRYTEALIQANPGHVTADEHEELLGQPLETIEGSVPPAGQYPAGCRFRDRCPHEIDPCSDDPVFVYVDKHHRHRCCNPVQR
jgi:peptide/nickel transport system ATP-binding protein